MLYSNQGLIDPAGLNVTYGQRPELDRWILSKYQQLISDVTESMDQYDHMKTVRAINDFVNEDSPTGISAAQKKIRKNFTEDKKSVYATTYGVGVARLIAPIAPFISDEIYVKSHGRGYRSHQLTSLRLTEVYR